MTAVFNSSLSDCLVMDNISFDIYSAILRIRSADKYTKCTPSTKCLDLQVQNKFITEKEIILLIIIIIII